MLCTNTAKRIVIIDSKIMSSNLLSIKLFSMHYMSTKSGQFSIQTSHSGIELKQKHFFL